MRSLLGLLISVALGCVILYYASGYGSPDASQQGEAAKAAIRPGMTWREAFAGSGNPKKYRPIEVRKGRTDGRDVESLVPGPAIVFRPDELEQRLSENGLPHGFTATFTYSSSVSFKVTFDGTGAVVGVDDEVTPPDLLHMKGN